MSAWFWVAWAILTLGNTALFFVNRHFHTGSVDRLYECQSILDEAKDILAEAKRLLRIRP